MSVVKGPLERVRKYTDSPLKVMVPSLKPYVNDTRDVLLEMTKDRFKINTY